MVASAQQFFKLLPGLIAAAYPSQSVDVPKGANIKCSLGLAEIIGVFVTHEVRAGSQYLLDPLDRLHKARIVRRDEADLAHQQHAGIERVAVEAFDERLALGRPGAGEDRVADRCRTRAPELR